MTRLTLTVLVAGALALGVAPAGGQTLSVGGTVTQPRSRLIVDGSREAIGGTWIGGVAGLEIGRVHLDGRASRGGLTSLDGSSALERDGGEVGLLLDVSAFSWLGVEAGHTVRAFTSAAGHQRWHLSAIGARFSGGLGSRALRASLRGGLFPRWSVTGQPDGERGVYGEVGVHLEPQSRISLAASYRIERYEFGAGRRAEQFDLLTLTAAVAVVR